jgi:hypothetical protein
MAILTISAQPGLRGDEIAAQVATRLHFELVTQARLEGLYASEFHGAGGIPARGYADVVASMLARLAAQYRLVFCGPGGEYVFRSLPDMLRIRIAAAPAVRAGMLMVEQGLDRPAAVAALRRLDREQSAWLRSRFRRPAFSAVPFDIALNAERRDSTALADAIVAAAKSLGMDRAGLLSDTVERQLQFEVQLRLARLGLPAGTAPRFGRLSLPGRQFAHPSEEIFANLLDFYRIPWEYEPRTFPLNWDEHGRAVESFTPDFYLPEFDLYVELTTMKQSLVTKKNRKIKRLRQLYPEINVQVFYQKDFENLIFKYGLEKSAAVLKK